MARPSKYTKALAAEICAELAQGKSLRSVCKQKGMPDAATVFRWLGSNEEFCEQYARAKEESADALVEEMLDIADDQDEHPQSRRVRIDTRKWISSKLKPKKYGDKITHSGDEDNPIKIDKIERVILDNPAD
jgi:hypothetical protein